MFQSTYLREWYTNGFNDIEQNAQLLDRFPGKLILNGRWDPREGEAGLRQLEADNAKYGLKGVKLYTAEWLNGSRGWKLTDPEAVPFLEMCRDLGIRNIHVHKGPTIWPLDKDAFDVSDVDHVATDFPELNFIVEHVGLPRIEDFCFMATQEPNVYAGMAVVVGGLMHARPRFFAKVMGELLFWVGEDKMLFGSDYAIWEPKWQVEGFVDWDYPDETYSDFPAWTLAAKKKVLGLNAAKLYGVEVPEELRLPVPADEPASRRAPWGSPGELALPRPRCARDGVRPGARRADHHARLRRLLRRDRRRRGRGAAAAPDAAVRAELRVPDGRRRAAAVRGVAGVRAVSVVLEDHYTGAEINAAVGSGEGFGAAFPGETPGELDALRELFQRKALLARQARLCQALLAGGAEPDAVVALRVAELPDTPDAVRAVALRAALGLPHGPDAPALVAGDGAAAAGGAAADVAAPRAPRAPEPGRQRRPVPRPAARPLRTDDLRWRRMKAARLHAYHEAAEARGGRRAEGRRPVRRDREDRRGRAVPHRPAHPGGAVGREVRRSSCPTRPATRTPAGCTRSAPA